MEIAGKKQRQENRNRAEEERQLAEELRTTGESRRLLAEYACEDAEHMRHQQEGYE